MEIYVYSKEMNLLGVADEIISLLWTRRYWSPGEFKLLVPFSEKHRELFSPGHLIIRDKDDEAAEIRYIHISRDSSGVEQIEAQGKFITQWVGKRMLAYSDNEITGSSQELMHQVMDRSVMEDKSYASGIPRLTYDHKEETIPGSSYTVCPEDGANALDVLEGIAKGAKLGFRIRTDRREGFHYFSVYKGKDRTDEQSDYPKLVFSTADGDILEQDFTHSVENVRNLAFVTGDKTVTGLGVWVPSYSAYTGHDRDELYISLPEISLSTYLESGLSKSEAEAAYKEDLALRGQAVLDEYDERMSFQSRLNTRGRYRYRRDFDVGDRVTCLDSRWGIKRNVRITEATQTFQQNGEELELTFGESMPTLLNRIKQIAKGR